MARGSSREMGAPVLGRVSLYSGRPGGVLDLHDRGEDGRSREGEGDHLHDGGRWW